MTDVDIQQAVLRELDWEPQVGSTEIGVSVKDGVVTLSGYVENYTKKYIAEQATKRVAGVKAVANDIEVRLPSANEKPDPVIAEEAVEALRWRIGLPHDRIKPIVRDGWITLEGEVDWQYQKAWAEAAVRDLKGVKGVTNLLTVKPHTTPKDVKAKIEEALKRSAEVDAKRISVEIDGATVTLRGTVRSWAEREEAEEAAWRAPGVIKVNNYISIEH